LKKQQLKNLLLTTSSLLYGFIAISQSEVVHSGNLEGLTYDYATKKLEGSLPFDEFTYLLIKKGGGDFYDKAFLYEIEYVKESKKEKDTVCPFPTDSCGEEAQIIEDSSDKDPKKVRRPKYKEVMSNKWQTKIFYSEEELNCFIKEKKRNPFEQKGKIKKTSDGKYEIEFRTGYYAPLQNLGFKQFGENGKSIKAIISPLKPGKLYEIVVNRKLKDNEISLVYEYLDLYRKGSVPKVNGQVDLCKAKDFYDSRIVVLESRLVRRIHNLTIFPEKHKDFVDSIVRKKLYTSINEDLLPQFIIPNEHIYPSDNLISEIGAKIKAEELDFKIYTKWMSLFRKSDENNDKEILKVLNGTNYPKSKSFDYHTISKNLKKNSDSLGLLKFELEKLLILDNSDTVNDFYNDFFETFYKAVTDNYETVDSYDKKVKKEFNRSLGVSELLSISTRGKTLKTANSKVLVPDFGFVNAFAHNQTGEIRYFARPYFGLNIHFRGINKEQRLGEIMDKSFRHRFSIAIGVTIGKIEAQGYTDLFNGISPMTGLNMRVSRQIRFGLGTLWLRENEANPIIDESRVQFAPYVSMSLDFGLFEQAGKLVGNVF
jgi:hypothetical protein